MNKPFLPFHLSILSNSVIAISYGLIASSAHAKSTAQHQVINIPATVVTATRLVTPTKDVIGDIKVIGKDELKMHQGQTAIEVLQSQPSIQVKSYGAIGQSGGIFIRGNNQNHALILVDGVRLGSATTGTTSLHGLGADQISRIEILYGSAGTSLYGSNAIGGVVQIFTKATESQNQASVLLSAGTEGSFAGSTVLNSATKNTQFGLNISKAGTDGINTTKSYVPFGAFEDDKDDYENMSYNFSVQHKPTKNLKLGMSMLSSNSDTKYDEGKKDQSTNSKTNLKNTSFWLTQQYDKLYINSKYGISEDNGRFDGNYGKSFFDTKQKHIQSELGYKLPIGTANLGIETLTQEVKSSVDFPTKSRVTKSYLAGYQFAENKLQGQANVRVDDIKDYKSVTNYALGLAYLPMQGVRFGASYATGFNQPTFNQLYYPKYGNPNLKPESSKNIEGFAELSNSSFTSRVTAYRNKVTDLISGSKNVNEAELSGISVKTDYQIDNIMLGLHYDYLDAQDLTAKKALANRAEHTGGIYASYNKPRYSVRGELNYIGKRRADYSDSKFKPVSSTLDAYTLANVYANYKISPYVDVNFRINNLLNENYETSYGYRTLGINGLAGIKLHSK